jgi:hypothetical protein
LRFIGNKYINKKFNSYFQDKDFSKKAVSKIKDESNRMHILLDYHIKIKNNQECSGQIDSYVPGYDIKEPPDLKVNENINNANKQQKLEQFLLLKTFLSS